MGQVRPEARCCLAKSWREMEGVVSRALASLSSSGSSFLEARPHARL